MNSRKVKEGQRVALVGLNPDVDVLLRAVLEDEGYVVPAPRAGMVELNEVERWQPNLILFATGRDADSMSLLDQLRTASATDAVPVIVLGTLAAVRDQAQASGNVYASLPMPFDLGELMDIVRGALDREPFESRVQQRPTEPDTRVLRGAEILLHAERELLLAWVQRIRAVEPFASRDDISLGEFLDSVPRIVNAVVLVLRQQTTPDVLSRDPEIQERIREHASVRRDQGVEAEAVAREYQVLRDVLMNRLRREMPAEDMLNVIDQLNQLLDEAVRITVSECMRLAAAGEQRIREAEPGP